MKELKVNTKTIFGYLIAVDLLKLALQLLASVSAFSKMYKNQIESRFTS